MGSQLHLSPDQVSRIRALLIRAGYHEYRHFILYLGTRALIPLLGFAAVLVSAASNLPCYWSAARGWAFSYRASSSRR
jgi:hypothetical protein